MDMTDTLMNTDLIIIGCGAGGLLASVTSGELGLNCMTLERRHRVGLKLLLCGNNRCNVSHAFTTEEMLRAYGEPTASFLRPAMTRFSPQALRNWFARNGLATCIKNDRIYPTTEKGDDVLHCFTDRMRDLTVPLMLNCPVTGLARLPEGGFTVTCEKLTLNARCVLLATGGVSYPKTGSVGDGQRMLAELGIDVTPLRPGLAGIDVRNPWLQFDGKCDLPQVRATVLDGQAVIAVTEGNMLCEDGCLRGTAIFDATRQIARHNLQSPSITLDLCPQMGAAAVDAALSRGGLAKLGIPEPVASALQRQLPSSQAGRWLKSIPLDIAGIRPLKEAIVTVGGVSLDEVNPETMELRRVPGLYVIGELLDVDGPTGGFNLHAAFATAFLAVNAIAEKLGVRRRRNPGEPSLPQVQPSRQNSSHPSRPAWQRRDNNAETAPMQAHRDHSERGKTARSVWQRWDDSHADGDRKTSHQRWDDSRSDAPGKAQRTSHNPESGKHPNANPRSRCDTRPGNRWDNSEFERKRTYDPRNN